MIRSSRLFLVASVILGLVVRLTAADSMNMKSDMKNEILSSCVKVSAALAADDFAAAKSAAGMVADHAAMSDAYKAVAPKAKAVAQAKDIKAAREAFKSLSAAVEPLATGEKGYVVMHCPMADADWVQTSKDVKNPYFGKSMLTCGEPKQAE
jgi:uncharacterized membrane-anchored protein